MSCRAPITLLRKQTAAELPQPPVHALGVKLAPSAKAL